MSRAARTLARQVSLRRVTGAPVRAGLVVLGVALGVCLWVAMLSTHEQLLRAFEDMVGRLGGRAQLMLTGSEGGVSMELLAEAADVPGVAHAAAVLEERSSTQDGAALLLLGIDLLGDPYFTELAPRVAEQGDAAVAPFDALAFISDPQSVLVSRELAKERGLKVGDALPLATAHGVQRFVVRGFVDPGGAVGSLSGHVVVMFLDALQMHFERGTLVDRIDLALSEGARRADVEARLQQRFAGRARVEPARGRARELERSLGAFRQGLLLSGLAALLVSLCLVYNAVAVAVAQRRQEIGILRALGLSRGGVVRLFLGEAAAIGVLGGVLGVALAGPLAELVLKQSLAAAGRFILPLSPRMDGFSARVWAWGVASGVIVSMLAAAWPARAAGRVEPASCIAQGRSGSALRPAPYALLACVALAGAALFAGALLLGGRGLTAGLAMGAACVVFACALAPLLVSPWARGLRVLLASRLGMGVQLAAGYVERAAAGSGLTVVVLMLAVGTSVTIETWMQSLERGILQWVDDGFPADLMVTSGSALLDQNHLPMAESLVEQVAKVPGVAHAYGVRSPDQYLRGQRVQLMSLDSRAYLGAQRAQGRARTLVEGPESLALDALHMAPRVLVSENLAQRLSLHVGDSLDYDTPRGPFTFTVYAVVRDFSSPEGWVLCDRRYYREMWGDPSIDQIDVLLRPAANPERVASRVRRALAGAGPMFVMDHARFKREVRSATQGTFAYAKAPQVLSLAVAWLAVLGAMLAACIDRTRDVGLLRAVGATRRQVRAMVVAEACLLAVLAALLGVVCGSLQGFVVVRVLGYALAGWELPFAFPWTAAWQVSAGAVLAAGLAAWLAGRWVARLSVPDALARA